MDEDKAIAVVGSTVAAIIAMKAIEDMDLLGLQIIGEDDSDYEGFEVVRGSWIEDDLPNRIIGLEDGDTFITKADLAEILASKSVAFATVQGGPGDAAFFARMMLSSGAVGHIFFADSLRLACYEKGHEFEQWYGFERVNGNWDMLTDGQEGMVAQFEYSEAGGKQAWIRRSVVDHVEFREYAEKPPFGTTRVTHPIKTTCTCHSDAGTTRIGPFGNWSPAISNAGVYKIVQSEIGSRLF